MSDRSCDLISRRLADRSDDESVLEHAARCPSCALELARQRFARESLTRLAAELDPPAELKRRLFRGIVSPAGTSPGRPSEAPQSREGRPTGGPDRPELREQLAEALTTLSERDAEVLRLLYGLSGEPSMGYEQVGSRLRITKERVRQIEARVMRRLRFSRPREGQPGWKDVS